MTRPVGDVRSGRYNGSSLLGASGPLFDPAGGETYGNQNQRDRERHLSPFDLCAGHRSTGGFTFNQFLVLSDEPLIFHTGLRKMFPLNREALSRVIAPERLRWIAFGHFEADECGAMNEWLAISPRATPAQGQTGCMVSLNDFADRTPRSLTDGEVIDLGAGKRVRFIDTPHTPHGWDACVLFEESTSTLMCGDLFTQLGNDKALTDRDVVGPAIAAEDIFKYSSLSPGMGATIRGLSRFAPRTLALMHGPSFTGDGAAALDALADDYDRRVSGQPSS